MFGGLSSWLESATEALNEISQQGADLMRNTGLLDLDERYNDTATAEAHVAAPAEDAASAAASTPLSLELVSEPPSVWEHSRDEWTYLITAALSDPNMGAIAPASLPEPERDALMETMRSVLSSDHGSDGKKCDPQLPSLTSQYVPTAELLTWFQAQQDLLQAYSAAVPEFTSEESFWNTLGWKLTALRLCRRPDALLAVCKVCAAKAALEESSSKSGDAVRASEEQGNAEEEENEEEEDGSETEVTRGAPNDASAEAEYWMHVEAHWEKLRAKAQYAAEQIAAVTMELEAADGNLKLLSNLIAKRDISSALAQSVVESCEYHKVKLTRLLASVIDRQDELQGSALDMHDGSVYPRLMKANHDLKLALAQAEGLKRGEAVTAPVPTATAVTSSPKKTQNDDDGASATPAAPSMADDDTTPTPAPTQSAVAAAIVVDDETAKTTDVTSSSTGTATAAAAGAAQVTLEDTSFEATLPWDDDDE